MPGGAAEQAAPFLFPRPDRLMSKHDAFSAAQARRWMRPNAHLYIRPDVWRFMPPGSPKYLGKDAVRYFWPDSDKDQAPQSNGIKDAASLSAERDELLRLRREFLAIKADVKFRGFLRAFKANFNPAQPRDDQGRWTTTGISDRRVLSDATPSNDWKPGAQYAQNRPRGGGGGPMEPTPAQAARLAVVEAESRAAIARVRELDPNWRPTPGIYESVDGLIKDHQAQAREAKARLRELADKGIGPGEFARESIPARGPGRDLRQDERDTLSWIFSKYGCHTCGTFEAGTASGNPIADHQPPTALNWRNAPQRLYPQCQTCSVFQGGWVRSLRRR